MPTLLHDWPRLALQLNLAADEQARHALSARAAQQSLHARHQLFVADRIHTVHVVEISPPHIADGRNIVLLPENPDFQPIVVTPHQEDFALEGLGIGVIRNPKVLS